MGWMDKTRAWLGSKILGGAAAETNAIASRLLGGSTSLRKGSEDLIEAYKMIPILRSAVQLIAESQASVEWSMYRAAGTKDGKSLLHKGLASASMEGKKRILKRLNDVELEEITNDPMIAMLDYGNPILSGFECRQVMATHFELIGEEIAWLQKNQIGLPIAYWPLNPTWVTEIPEGPEGHYLATIGGEQIKFSCDEIFYMRDPDPSLPTGRGAGVGITLGDELDTDEYASKFLRSFFLNDATPSMILAFDGANIDALRRVEQQWDDKHRGPSKRSRIHWLTQSPDVTTFDTSFKDMQLQELRDSIRDLVRETWRIPPELLGIIENSNRATIDSAAYIFARWNQVPRLERKRIALQRQVVGMYDERKVLCYESPVSDDKDFELMAMQATPTVYTVNEWREMGGKDPIEGGEELYSGGGGGFSEGDYYPRESDGSEEEEESEESEDTEEEDTEEVKGLVKKTLSPTELERSLDQIDPEALNSNTLFWEEELTRSGVREMEGLPTDLDFDPTSSQVADHTQDFRKRRMAGISRTTEWRVRKFLEEKIREGQTVGEIAESLDKKFKSLNTERAKTIAQTEVLRSHNFAQHQAHKQSGVVVKREWIAVLDGETRDSHEDTDGQMVGLDQPFTLGSGVKAMTPGSTGIPEEDINCRCTTKGIVEGGKALEGGSRGIYWKEFDSSMRKWESRARRGFEDGLNEQIDAVLRQIKKYQ